MAVFHNLLEVDCPEEGGPDDDEKMLVRAAGCGGPSLTQELCAKGVLAPPQLDPSPTRMAVGQGEVSSGALWGRLCCVPDALMTTHPCSASSQTKQAWWGGVGQ